VYLVHMRVRIVGQIIDSALNVVEVGTATLYIVTRADVIRYEYSPSSLLVRKVSLSTDRGLPEAREW
jgi:hypothetical protein